MGEKHYCCPKCGGLKITETSDSKGQSFYKCMECRCRFGNKSEAIEYSNLLSKFSMEIKDLLGNRFSIRLVKENNRYKFYTKIGKPRVTEGELTEDFWTVFSTSLFQEFAFHRWSESYFGITETDGVLWDFEASFERRHTISVHGCNSYPVYWNSVVSSILPVLDQVGLCDTFIHRLAQE